MSQAGIYIHIPFCRSRCSYCDFATEIYREHGVVERYVDALCVEIRRAARDIEADTVYFGGGTPSLLTPSQVGRIMNVVRSSFLITRDAEITMEMNPATVTQASLAEYRTLGVNRASFGVQTFDDDALRLLARGHSAADALETFRLLRESGFDNVSFDLIAGLPEQTMDGWRQNLEKAVELEPEHISLYLLEIHEGTPLSEQIRSRRRPMPDEDLAADMYEVMLDRLSAAGFYQYEISNFAVPGRESRHNTKYWRLDPVYGFGVSAHSFDGRERFANERDTARYVSLIESGRSAETHREKVDAASEFVFLGLRLIDGIDLDEYRSRYDRDLVEEKASDIAELTDAGLVDVSDGRLRLTRRGLLLSNEVFSRFV